MPGPPPIPEAPTPSGGHQSPPGQQLPPPLEPDYSQGRPQIPGAPPVTGSDKIDDPTASNNVAYRSYNEEHSISSRPCENCGGQLEFDIEHQQLGCNSCGHRQDITHADDAAVLEQDFRALLKAGRSQSNERMVHEDNEKEIVCQNCGGHTTFVGTLTTTKCPYCATDLARTDVHEAPDRLIVDGVLPFVITEDAAQAKLEAWVNKRWFAPTEFKKYSTAGSFESIYAAYFTYDAFVTTNYDGERGTTRTRTVGHGKNQRTETYTTWRRASGTVHDEFDDITVLANTGFHGDYVHKLEPWPTQELQPYNPDYIAGHLCRTYDVDAEDCFEEAHARIKRGVESTVRRDIGGDQQRIHRMNMQMSNLTYKHVLLPIWLLTVLYEGHALQVFMNGTTGEIHGQRPWSKVKIGATIAAVVLLIVIIAVIRSASGG